jgi:UDP-N-acetylglucosamine 2-epimerase (non-hydrolysing)
MLRVSVVLGTRPEAIKLAPLIRELRARSDAVHVHLIFSGQHPDLVQPIFDFFGLHADQSLDVMVVGQGLAALTSRAVLALDEALAAAEPDYVIVQGDTTTAMGAALAAFYRHVPVAHVEAGLRTNLPYSPFPEEINRRCIGQLATLHWAPTAAAAEALRREGLPLAGGRIVVTGNTGIDAVLIGLDLIRAHPVVDPSIERIESFQRSHPRGCVILVTAHRRENFGEPARELCRGIRDVAKEFAEALFIFPVHPNPQIHDTVERDLGGLANVVLTPPRDYPTFLRMMDLCDGIVTDSGGVQEEAPALGKLVLVTRSQTERPEGIRTGHIKVVGPNHDALVEGLRELIVRRQGGAAPLNPAYPYGDGRAARRCVASLLGEPFTEFAAPA